MSSENKDIEDEKRHKNDEGTEWEDMTTLEIVRRCGRYGMSKMQTFETLRAYKGYAHAWPIYKDLRDEAPTQEVIEYHRGLADRDMVAADAVTRAIEKGTKTAIHDYIEFTTYMNVKAAISDMLKI